MRADPRARHRIVEEFTTRAIAAGCTVATAADVADLGLQLMTGPGDARVSAAGARLARMDATPSPSSPHDLVSENGDNGSTAVIGASAAIAETGSVVLTHDDLGELWLAGLSEHLVVVVSAATIVDTLVDAEGMLEALNSEGRSWTLLTGPSRTADIERTLTIGVQGSFTMHVVIGP